MQYKPQDESHATSEESSAWKEIWCSRPTDMKD
jgi:hypothetical protein